MRLVQEGYRCLFYVGGRIPCGGRIPQSTSFYDGGDEFDDGWLLREAYRMFLENMWGTTSYDFCDTGCGEYCTGCVLSFVYCALAVNNSFVICSLFS